MRYFQKARDASFHGMIDVVDEKRIAVVPSVNIQNGIFVVAKEWARQAGTSIGFSRDAEGLLKKKESCGVNHEAAPLDGARRARASFEKIERAGRPRRCRNSTRFRMGFIGRACKGGTRAPGSAVFLLLL